jgi:hypothetical protein
MSHYYWNWRAIKLRWRIGGMRWIVEDIKHWWRYR